VTESLRELDRRRFVRFPVAVPVIGRAARGGELELRGTVRNVSGGGLMAEFAIQVQHGSTVYLTLEAGEGPLPVEGRVLWVDHPGERVRHGVAFPDPKGYAFGLQLFLSEYRGAAVRTAPEPAESFEIWLLRRVRLAVEAGEVPESLFPELRDEVQAAEEQGTDAGRAVVVRQVADLAGIDRKLAAEVLDTIEAQRTVTGEMLKYRIAEAWLESQRGNLRT